MANITISIPDAQLARAVNALCTIGGWDSTSGVTKGEFAHKYVADWLKQQVFAQEQAQAAAVAVQSLGVTELSVT